MICENLEERAFFSLDHSMAFKDELVFAWEERKDGQDSNYIFLYHNALSRGLAFLPYHNGDLTPWTSIFTGSSTPTP